MIAIEMGAPNAAGDWSSEMEVDAFRRLFPLGYYECHLSESICPDARPLKKARDSIVSLGAVTSSDGSALAKIGSTVRQTMLAAIKMEVMTPSVYSPDEGSIVVEFHMPPTCSPVVRPGRPAEELSLIKGKAAWMAYLDIYCLDADGALFNAALLSAVAAFSHLDIPVVSLNDEGRMAMVSKELEGEKLDKEPAVKRGENSC